MKFLLKISQRWLEFIPEIEKSLFGMKFSPQNLEKAAGIHSRNGKPTFWNDFSRKLP